MADNVNEVLANINLIYKKKELATVALCKQYAAIVIRDFKQKQNTDHFWINRSGFARDLMFTEDFVEKDAIGFFMAHAVEYGISLELGNDEQNAAIRPTLNNFLPQFKSDLNQIWR